MLAFDDRDAIRLLDTATGNLRVLWDGRARSTKRDRLGLQGGLSWSPDGDRIAFGVRDDVSDPEPGGWTGSWTVENAYSVGVASADVVRLTGSPPGPGIPDDLAAVPVGYWPDGSRIFFTSAALGQMNADGSCEREFPVSVEAAVWPPDVRPGLGPIKCSDLAVRIEPSTEWPLRGTRRLRVTIWNDGNLDAAPRVLVSLSRGLRARRVPADCALLDRRHLACGFPRLGPQRVSRIELVVTDSRAGRFAVRARVLPGVADPRRNNLSDETVFVSTCTRFGTSRSDTIVIRRGPAKVCAHAGDDRVIAVNRVRDVVDCGPGDDTAILDRRDVAQRCERVLRR